MHVSRSYTGVAAGLAETGSLVGSGTLPLLYAGAMLVDAVAALVFGLLYDRKGVRVLVWSTLISAPFAVFVFGFHSVAMLLLGATLAAGCALEDEYVRSNPFDPDGVLRLSIVGPDSAVYAGQRVRFTIEASGRASSTRPSFRGEKCRLSP